MTSKDVTIDLIPRSDVLSVIDREAVLQRIEEMLNSQGIKHVKNQVFRLDGSKFTLDFYCPDIRLGIKVYQWKRSVPVNKIYDLEFLLNEHDLNRIIVVCNNVSYNAKKFLQRSDVRIDLILTRELFDEMADIHESF